MCCGGQSVEARPPDDPHAATRHHSSNEDLKEQSARVRALDAFVGRLVGRYRAPTGDIAICSVRAGDRSGLYLERTEDGGCVEHRLWLAEPAEFRARFVEYHLAQPAACSGLALQLAPTSIGPPVSEWTVPARDVPTLWDPQEDRGIGFARHPSALIRSEAGLTTSYRPMQRGSDGHWRFSDDAQQQTVASSASTQTDDACPTHSCPAGTSVSVSTREQTRCTCVRPDGVEHGPVSVFRGRTLLFRGAFVDGQRDGDWRLYAANGSVLAEGAYRRGERHGRWTWHNLSEVAAQPHFTPTVGLSVRAWAQGGDPKPTGQRDNLIEIFAKGGHAYSMVGEFSQGQLHGEWIVRDGQGNPLSTKAFDQGVLTRLCKHAGGTPTCSQFLKWRQIDWNCELPDSKPRLFESASQLAAVVSCAHPGVRWGQERLIGLRRSGRASPSTTVRSQQAGGVSEVTVNADAFCGGARRHNAPNTLWLAVASDGTPWRLGHVQSTCMRTP